MITVHFNDLKRRFDILKLLSMLDGRIERRKQVKRAKYSAWWDNFISETDRR